MDELGLFKSSSPYQLGDGMCSPHIHHSLKDEHGLPKDNSPYKALGVGMSSPREQSLRIVQWSPYG